MRTVFNSTQLVLFAALLFSALGFSTPTISSVANASERQFLTGIEGKWYGPGEIVAGKFKGTKFTCKFDGSTETDATGMRVDGTCRIGMVSQPMNARFMKQGNSYVGQFLDGEKGEGMDVTGGRYTSSRLVVSVKRKQLNGTMVARLDGDKRLNVTISVDVQGQMVPVIGMALDKTGPLN